MKSVPLVFTAIILVTISFQIFAAEGVCTKLKSIPYNPSLEREPVRICQKLDISGKPVIALYAISGELIDSEIKFEMWDWGPCSDLGCGIGLWRYGSEITRLGIFSKNCTLIIPNINQCNHAGTVYVNHDPYMALEDFPVDIRGLQDKK